MEHSLEETIALLSRTPRALNALLRDLPEVWTLRNEGHGTWSVFDIIVHLIDGERVNWMLRAKWILQFCESRAFEPFDREGHKREGAGKSLEELLDEFARLRAGNIEELSRWDLSPERLSARGLHPAFGAVTLSQLLATWATHDLTHLHQISRVMAYQYRDAVGPWKQYLGVLRCTGHSGN